MISGSLSIVSVVTGEGFTIAMLNPEAGDVSFDWWIVGVEKEPQPTTLTNPPTGGPMTPPSPTASDEASNDQNTGVNDQAPMTNDQTSPNDQTTATSSDTTAADATVVTDTAAADATTVTTDTTTTTP